MEERGVPWRCNLIRSGIIDLGFDPGLELQVGNHQSFQVYFVFYYRLTYTWGKKARLGS